VVLSSAPPSRPLRQFDLGFSDPPLVLETSGVNFSLRASTRAAEVLIAFLADTLREPSVVITEKTASRLVGHILARRPRRSMRISGTRRASVMSLVRDLVATFGANDDALLACSAAFAYDLVFQIEDIVQKRARENDQRDIVLICAGSPARLRPCHRAPARF